MLSWPSPSSLWLAQLPKITPTNPVRRDLCLDVAIAGGGYSALWSAYYLKKADPTLRIGIFEAKYVGFGASGRNGGWASALFPSSLKKVEKIYGLSATVDLRRALIYSIDEISKVTQSEAIQCDFVKGGTVTIATNQAQLDRINLEREQSMRYKVGPYDDTVLLNSSELANRVNANGALGGLFSPHCARIQPARLARGLFEVVRGLGVEVFEGSMVTAIKPGSMEVNGHIVTAKYVIDALEGYRSRLFGAKSETVPVYSLMIATKQLDDKLLGDIGFDRYETLTDARNLIIYAQRSADNRIVFGGRGAPYHFGSKISPNLDYNTLIFDRLQKSMVELFPMLSGVEIEFKWGGPLGVPRDLFSFVRFSCETGTASLGGYVGDGVTLSNLAARTLADLILGRKSEFTSLCIVNHLAKPFEPEPARFIGINGTIQLAAFVDKLEERGLDSEIILSLLDKVIEK